MDLLEKNTLYKCNTCGITHQIPVSAQKCCPNFSLVSVYRCPICRCSYDTPTEAYECRIHCTDKLLNKATQWIIQYQEAYHSPVMSETEIFKELKKKAKM